MKSIRAYKCVPFQPQVFCTPTVAGNGGMPAGCEPDRQGNLWVADMRLGILKVKDTGECEQVSFDFNPFKTCTYRQVSNISRTLVGNEMVDH